MKGIYLIFNFCPDYTEGGAVYSGSEVYRSHIDEETLHLIESEHLLVDRECLTLADEIGKGMCLSSAVVIQWLARWPDKSMYLYTAMVTQWLACSPAGLVVMCLFLYQDRIRTTYQVCQVNSV